MLKAKLVLGFLGVLRVNWKLEDISRNGDGSFKLTYDTPEGSQTLETKCLALTAPAYVVADLLESSCVSFLLCSRPPRVYLQFACGKELCSDKSIVHLRPE